MIRVITMALMIWLEMLRRKDVYVLLILLAALLGALISVNVFGLGATAGYVEDVGLLGVWLFGWILSINIGARQIPEEEKRGTIYPLLAKPITRLEFILGKWLGAWTAAGAATLAFHALVVLVVIWRGGAFEGVALFQAIALQLTGLAVVSALAVTLSARLNADAASTLCYVLSGGLFLFLPSMPHLLAGLGGVKGAGLMAVYYLLPHFELFDMRRRLIHDYGPASWPVFFFVAAYGAVLAALFLSLAWIGYRRKRFSREVLR